jgi:hypothetical protein
MAMSTATQRTWFNMSSRVKTREGSGARTPAAKVQSALTFEETGEAHGMTLMSRESPHEESQTGCPTGPSLGDSPNSVTIFVASSVAPARSACSQIAANKARPDS